MRVATRALLAMVLAVAVTAQAHHSFAMFDQTQQVTLKGTVHEFSVDESARLDPPGCARRQRHQRLVAGGVEQPE